MSFVHLSLHSEYSLNDSLVRVKPLMKSAAAAGMPAVAITDDSNMFCVIKAYNSAMAQGVKPIIGAQVQVQTSRSSATLLTILCKDNDGYRALKEIISDGYLTAPRDSKSRPIIPLSWFAGKSEGLIALSGGRQGEIGKLLLSGRNSSQVMDSVSDFHEIFGDNFYLELQRIGHGADDRYVKMAVDLAIETGLPVVATNPVRFMKSEEHRTHDIRVAISQGRTVRDLQTDHEPEATQHQYLKTPEEMIELFSDIPVAIENTVAIAAQCSVDLELGKNYLPSFPVPQDMTEGGFLEHSAREGLEKRLRECFLTDEAIAQHREEYEERLKFELGVINEMGFPGYFLIVADFIRWAKKNDIPVGPGRGSGAGSLVAYSIGITDLNPIPYNLLFERFLNPERVSMPDFDIDFCMDERDRVIGYVADHYGHDAVSQIITFGTMAAKSSIQSVTRALSMPYRFGLSLSNLIPKVPGMTLEKAWSEVESIRVLYDTDPDTKLVWDYARAIEGLCKQTGMHAGGVVIAPTKLTDFTPVYCEPDGSSLVSQFDKDDVEAAGLVKFDFLGLRNLTIIKYALTTINQTRKEQGLPPLNINHIDLEDRKTFGLLQRCETTAVFQLESTGMKALVKQLVPDCFEDIIALVALFRPGPLQSGMVGDFVDRKHGRAEVSYPHPLLKPILENTYGVIVYQEQVMQIAQVLAGYTLGGADMLRRAMGKKKPEEMAKQREIFIKGATANDVDATLAGSIFDLMEKFAEYGFNKSHSAAYALIAYQTAYLKAHYPEHFMAAVLSSDMGEIDKVVRFIHEARTMGLEICPPHVNHSMWHFTPKDGKILYGFGAIKGLGAGVAEQFIENRRKVGEYENLNDFHFLNNLKRPAADACIHAGMFDYTGMDRSELIAISPLAMAAGKQLRAYAGQGMLFDMDIPPVARMEVDSMEVDLRLRGERKVLGLYLTGHPYDRYRHALKTALTASLSEVIANAEDDTIEREDKYYNVVIAGLVTDFDVKQKKTTKAYFKLDDGTARLDCSVFAKEFNDYQAFLQNDNLVVIEGRVKYDPKSKKVSLSTNSVQLLDNYLQVQSGRVVVQLPEGASLFKEMAKVHGLAGMNDEGSIRVYIQAHGSTDPVELPTPPISSNGPAMQKLVGLWGEAVKIEYVKQQTRTPPRKTASDIAPVDQIENLEAHRETLRLELEKALQDAEIAMKASLDAMPSLD